MIRKYLLTLFFLLSLIPNSYAGLIIDGTNLTASVSVQSNTLSNISGSGATLLNITFYDTEITVNESCTITNVIGYNTLGSDIVIAVGKTVTGTTNIFGDAAKSGDGTYTDSGGTLWSSDPLFTNAAGGDFWSWQGPGCKKGTYLPGYTTKLKWGEDFSDLSNIKTIEDALSIGAYACPKGAALGF